LSYLTPLLFLRPSRHEAARHQSADLHETASSAAYRLELAGRWPGRLFRPLIDKLMFFDPDHCRKAYRAEINGWQQPPRTP